MTPQQISLVEASFRAIFPIRDAAAEIFYRRLFALDPGLRPLFARTDMADQGKKLMASIAFVVGGLKNAETIVPAIEALARRHVGYGVEPGHYRTVGAALIETLDEGLGDAFTPEVHEAWTAAYGLLSGVMLAAAGAEPALA
jgi:hemoglobin-like flavoprotein